MKYLLLIYVVLAVVAIAIIELPHLRDNPLLEAKDGLDVNDKIESGDLLFVPEGPLYVRREVPQGQTVRYYDLARKPSAKRQLGQVPYAVGAKRDELETAGIRRHRRVFICDASDTTTPAIPATVDSIVCGLGAQDCLAVVQLDEDKRPTPEAASTLTLKTTKSCE